MTDSTQTTAPSAAMGTDERALTEDVGAVWVERDVVRIAGPDAETFLQGQLSQDVAAVVPGAPALTFLLQPQGKVVALGRLSRQEDGAFLFDTDAPFGPAVATRLERFKLRVDCHVEPLAWRVLALRGARALQVGEEAVGEEVAAGERSDGVIALASDWPGWPGVDLLGPAPEVPTGVRECSPAAGEALRIAFGVPRMGAELDERTIPAESGLVDRAASFTKGCYTGQELVARIDSRGHVNRHLRRLVIEGETVPLVGATLHVGAKEVGILTSAASSATRGIVALGYVRREVEPPATVEVRWPGGVAEARVEEGP